MDKDSEIQRGFPKKRVQGHALAPHWTNISGPVTPAQDSNLLCWSPDACRTPVPPTSQHTVSQAWVLHRPGAAANKTVPAAPDPCRPGYCQLLG